MFLTPVLVAAAMGFPQEPPPPLIHTYQPASGAIDGDWTCRGGHRVRYRIEIQWDRVQVQSFVGLAGEATDDDLRRLNEALDPIWVIAELSFKCSRGADELIIGGPVKGGGPKRVVIATWYDGRMRLNIY